MEIANRRHTNESIKWACILDLLADQLDPFQNCEIAVHDGRLVIDGRIKPHTLIQIWNSPILQESYQSQILATVQAA
jgi:hypothetical protein